eukprot:scaffold112565_cov82-Phaeocystis_antarctica.AAC.1
MASSRLGSQQEVGHPRSITYKLPFDAPCWHPSGALMHIKIASSYIVELSCVFVCVHLRTFLLGRPSRSCVCRVGTPPAR